MRCLDDVFSIYKKNLDQNPDPKLTWKPDPNPYPNPYPDPKEIISDPKHWLEDKKTVVKTDKMVEIKTLFKQNTGEYSPKQNLVEGITK